MRAPPFGEKIVAQRRKARKKDAKKKVSLSPALFSLRALRLCATLIFSPP
jgi:hypothetical protein